ncbi:transposase [Sporosarcina ureae]|uniref:transposase n=1 Tax=Sporosarcina ureae TaxID=1571 RepID=UPI0028A75814|nr:transposase [Sporosarcina ureae]
MSKKYDDEFKEKVAKEAIDINNIAATAKKYDVNANSVSKWVKDIKKKHGIDEIITPVGLNEKEITLFNREIIELKTQLAQKEKELEEAKLLIGEKGLYINRLEKALNG